MSPPPSHSPAGERDAAGGPFMASRGVRVGKTVQVPKKDSVFPKSVEDLALNEHVCPAGGEEQQVCATDSHLRVEAVCAPLIAPPSPGSDCPPPRQDESSAVVFADPTLISIGEGFVPFFASAEIGTLPILGEGDAIAPPPVACSATCVTAGGQAAPFFLSLKELQATVRNLQE